MNLGSICLWRREGRGLALAVALVFATSQAGCSSASSPREAKASSLGRLHVFDLDNQMTDPFPGLGSKATVFVFVSTDCPISNRYAPELRRLYERFGSQGVKFWLVYPDSAESTERIRRHVQEFKYLFEALRDPKHELVKATGVRVTPEVAVFLPGPTMVYHGRIDDRYVDFGKERPAPTKRDLQEVLESILSGRPFTPASTLAVGCYIAPP